MHSAVGMEFSVMERLQPVLVWGLRTLIGLLLGLALGVVGLGLGWVLFVFFGATSHAALLTLMMGGAALGSAAGAFLAWLQLDRNTLPMFLGVGLVLLLAGIVGAWGGFQIGADQEVPCCAGPEIGPMTYTILGAVLVSNIVALLMGVIQTLRQVGLFKRHSQPRPFQR